LNLITPHGYPEYACNQSNKYYSPIKISRDMGENTIDNYGWTSAQAPHSCGYITPRILKILKELRVQRVLDVGAGNGKLCSELSRLGYQAVGIEHDKQGVEIARMNFPKIPFYNFGVQDNPADLLAQETSFDAVVSTEVVEHLFSPHLLPIYARGVLREGGFLVLTTPYHGYLKNLVLSVLNKWDSHHTPLWHGGHIKFWSRATLGKLIREHGFNVIGFSGVGRFPYLWKSMILIGQKKATSLATDHIK
jgi:2-polyprenyl-3-methyl-5-hydroxy-6-metoxy-1,4-benzoquinol methylase